MEQFKIIQPTKALMPYVKHYWILRSDDIYNKQRIIPTGNLELFFHRECPLKLFDKIIPTTSLSGQRNSFADLTPTGVVNMIAVVFHPFGVKAFFDMPICELFNQIVSSDDLGILSLNELADRIQNSKRDEECITLIESFLMYRFKLSKEYNYERMSAAVNAINSSDICPSVANIAEKVCLSNKQFQRIFNEYIGITPKEFIRIVRFHKALFMLQNNVDMNFTALAYECGYYDLSHMTNEFKLFSGYTPTQYVSICTPYSDYFST